MHRRLSGAFMTCIRLRTVMPCRDLLMEVKATVEEERAKKVKGGEEGETKGVKETKETKETKEKK